MKTLTIDNVLQEFESVHLLNHQVMLELKKKKNKEKKEKNIKLMMQLMKMKMKIKEMMIKMLKINFLEE